MQWHHHHHHHHHHQKFFLTFSPDHGMQISFLEEKKIWIFFGDDGDGDDDGENDVEIADCGDEK